MSQERNGSVKGKLVSIIIALLLVAGLSMTLYPLASNLYYEHQQEKLTDEYDQLVEQQLPESDRIQQLQACYDYNKTLIKGGVLLTDPFEEAQLDPTAMPYAGLLNPQGDGSMGYLTIPAIDVNLVIYHGVEEDILQKGVGHLQGSSLPVGGVGTHSVLSAHTGLGDKKLFTDLNQLVEGDFFHIYVLGEELTYQVDQIRVVLPNELDDLRINAEQDYVTLVTCTPYGINSHRLLVRGTRVENNAIAEQTVAQPQRGSTWRQQYLKALSLGAGILGVGALAVFAVKAIRKGHKEV